MSKKTAGAAVIENSGTAETPVNVRAHLRRVAEGEERLDQAHLEALVAKIVLREELAVAGLADFVEVTINTLAGLSGSPPKDYGTAMSTLIKYAQLHQHRQSGLLRLVELLHKISSPQRPQVQITAVAAAGVQVRGDE